MENRMKLRDEIYFNQIETDKFKSNLLTFYIVRPLNEDEATMNALLPLVLRRGTRTYNSNLKIEKKLEELYGTKIGASILVRGNKHVLRIAVQFVNDKYVNDESFLKEVIDLIYSMVFDPYLEEGSFKKEYVEQEKRNLKRRIEGKINDKREYAIEEAIKIMCSDESFSISNLGYIEALDKIDADSLYDHYKKLLKESPIEIFHIGEKNDRVKRILEEKTFGNREDIISFKRETIKSEVDEIKYKNESLDVSQGKLVLGYRTGIPYENKLYDPLLVANVIFGAGSNSKLFLNVRERESLAYYIVSRVYKYKSILMIDAGIDFDKYDRTLEIIEEELYKMKNGEITDEEIDIAKSAIVSSLNSTKDSIGSLGEIEFGNLLTNDSRSLDNKIKDIKEVTKEEIVKACQGIILDTVYFMKNDKIVEVENNEVI